ncbi:hypothetical protein M3O57_15745 [Xanthomonas nasturtii]|uniref:Uncharacterized protein n=1 Tax=Xanthomonas nasturtii TaxID=1843581 RepID=A0A3E1KHF6_9XANT|nr:hypothetical protein [Xanthomonas nasturtii]MCL1501091.1 hypothetical protein [Xanthomonas nasturtii]MCL1504791.1 hypothetical protein [Xanthomonas nasturtii]MCL1524398.1 hypothetical protein [Xanthomonas nasturtii]MCL1526830.1 hypothetical protein [Xanthomonas nasturtii]MCL1531927.1 hypothetical protein [Xanthomonas nasturtii]
MRRVVGKAWRVGHASSAKPVALIARVPAPAWPVIVTVEAPMLEKGAWSSDLPFRSDAPDNYAISNFPAGRVIALTPKAIDTYVRDTN